MGKSTKKFRRNGHAFRFKIAGVDGKENTLVAWARVRNAKTPVVLKLTAADVQRSIDLEGSGNTQTCSMAVCAQRQASAFKHPVEGYIDWFYRTAFVVSKVDPKTGMPSECFAYEHQDNIARLNDTKGGQEKLLALLKQHGDREIHLHPVEKRKRKAAPGGSGKKDRGMRKKPSLKGASLRFAVAKLGGVG